MTLWQWLLEVSGATAYPQHITLANDPIMILYVAGDLATFLACMVTGGALLHKRHQPRLLSSSALSLYGTCIALGGLSHLTKTLSLSVGAYRLDVFVVATLAAVSAVTAVRTVSQVYGPEN